MNNINWYPGHMKKTKDMILEQIKLVDLVIEILDARIPLSSKNPDVYNFTKSKKRIVLLNKLDLINEKQLNEYKNYFLNNNLADMFIPISVEKGTNIAELKKQIKKMYNEKLEIVKKKGLLKTQIRAMVVGIPNVGKSKFINKIANKNKAKVGNLPGFTKGKQWIRVDDNFELLDTPGILWPKFEDDYVAMSLAITGSIRDNVLPIEEVCIEFLNRLRQNNLINNLVHAYKLEINDLSSLENHEILDILVKRLEIKRASENDYESISQRVLKDYRQGKIGKFIIENIRESEENNEI